MKTYKDKNNNLFSFEENGSQDHLISKEHILINKDELKIIQENFQKSIQDQRTYIEKRQEAYPPIAEQLDIIYHTGIEHWKEIILEIKLKFPKD